MRYSFIDYLRFYSCLLVVLLHTISLTLSTSGNNISDASIIILATIHFFAHISVPIFVMISGALFLNSTKEINIRDFYSINLVKILIGIVFFGTLYALMEIVFEKRNFHIQYLFYAFINMLQNKTWTHMWYLYMCLGLYLFIPFLKFFISSVDKKIVFLFVGIIFFFTVFIPFCNALLNINIGFSFPIGSVYVYYLLMGYLCIEDEINFPAWIVVLSLLVYLSYPIFYCVTGFISKKEVLLFSGIPYSNYIFPVFVPILFSKVKKYWNSDSFLQTKRGRKILSCCYGVYIIHPVFLNFIFKVIKINIIPSLCFIFVIGIFFVCVFFSFLSILLAKKIPIIKKYLF